MYVKRISIPLTTLANGSVVAYSEENITGRIVDISYVKTDFVNGVDFAVTGDVSGKNIWTQANVDAAQTVAPRQPTHTAAGVAILYAAAGEPVHDYIALADERIKVVIASGGDTKTGELIITVN